MNECDVRYQYSISESTSISMVVDKWKEGQVEQCSLVQRINGYPWYGLDYVNETSIERGARGRPSTDLTALVYPNYSEFLTGPAFYSSTILTVLYE